MQHFPPPKKRYFTFPIREKLKSVFFSPSHKQTPPSLPTPRGIVTIANTEIFGFWLPCSENIEYTIFSITLRKKPFTCPVSELFSLTVRLCILLFVQHFLAYWIFSKYSGSCVSWYFRGRAWRQSSWWGGASMPMNGIAQKGGREGDWCTSSLALVCIPVVLLVSLRVITFFRAPGYDLAIFLARTFSFHVTKKVRFSRLLPTYISYHFIPRHQEKSVSVRFCNIIYISFPSHNFHSTSPTTKSLFPLGSTPGYSALLPLPCISSPMQCNFRTRSLKSEKIPLWRRLLGQNIRRWGVGFHVIRAYAYSFLVFSVQNW